MVQWWHTHALAARAHEADRRDVPQRLPAHLLLEAEPGRRHPRRDAPTPLPWDLDAHPPQVRHRARSRRRPAGDRRLEPDVALRRVRRSRARTSTGLLAGVGGAPHRRSPGHRVLRPALSSTPTPHAGTTPDDRGARRRGSSPTMARFDPDRDLDPHETYLLGFARASMNRFDSAIRLMEESVRRDPGNPKSLDRARQPVPGAVPPETAAEAYRGRSPCRRESRRRRSSSPPCSVGGRTRPAPSRPPRRPAGLARRPGAGGRPRAPRRHGARRRGAPVGSGAR